MSEDPVIMNEMFENLKDADVTAAVFLKGGIRLIGKILKIDPEAILMTGPTKFGLAVARESVATVQEFSQSQYARDERRPMK
jgi:predicted hydrocarbon binding protein